MTSCFCPDVKTSCIKLIAESIRLHQIKNELEIAYWIGHNIGTSAAAENIEICEEEDETFNNTSRSNSDVLIS